MGYIKKVRIVEAVQFTNQTATNHILYNTILPKGIVINYTQNHKNDFTYLAYLKTPTSILNIKEGDWIVDGTKVYSNEDFLKKFQEFVSPEEFRELQERFSNVLIKTYKH